MSIVRGKAADGEVTDAPMAGSTGHDARRAQVEAWCAERTVEEICAALLPAGVPVAPVRSIPEVAQDPHLWEREMLVKMDDPVAGEMYLPGGACPACLSGQPGCINRYRYWLQSVDEPPHFRGAYGEYYYLRKGQTVSKVPAELTDNEVSPVNCALCQALYGLDRIGIRLGDTIVVQGAGGLGLYASALARDMGAAQIIVFDKRADRLALAREFGATHSVNIDETSEKDRRELVRSLTRGHGADVVAEFVGVPSAVEEGTRLLRQGGRYLWIGNITPGWASALDPGTVVRSAQTVKGVIVWEPWVLPRALDFLARRRDAYPFGKIVSHVFPFEEINRAFTFADEGQAIRVSLAMR